MAEERILAALASSDGIVVNRHFGRAEKFYIYDIGNELPEFLEVREVSPVCESGNHDEGKLEKNMQLIADCRYLIVTRIGDAAYAQAERFGIEAYEIADLFEDAIERLKKFIKLRSLFD